MAEGEELRAYMVSDGRKDSACTLQVKRGVTGEEVYRKDVASLEVANEFRIPTAGWATDCYELGLMRGDKRIAHAVFIVRPQKPRGAILFVLPTDMWRAYTANSPHGTSVLCGMDKYQGYSYANVVTGGPSPRNDGKKDIPWIGGFWAILDQPMLRALREIEKQYSLPVDCCAMEDVCLGKVNLGDYSLVVVGPHAEFVSFETFKKFEEFLANDGGVIFTGGDNFAVAVDYWPPGEDWIYQRILGHFLFGTWTDQDTASPARWEKVRQTASRGWLVNRMTFRHGPGVAMVVNNTHPITKDLELGKVLITGGGWEGDMPLAWENWHILLGDKPFKAPPKVNEPDPAKVSLCVHKYLRLGFFGPLNFTMKLGDFDSKYGSHAENGKNAVMVLGRLVQHLYQKKTVSGPTDYVPPEQAGKAHVVLGGPVQLNKIRIQLPSFRDETVPSWWTRPGDCANYKLEVSADGKEWKTLVDKDKEYWRGWQTDTFEPQPVKEIKVTGRQSDGKDLQVLRVEAYGPARP